MSKLQNYANWAQKQRNIADKTCLRCGSKTDLEAIDETDQNTDYLCTKCWEYGENEDSMRN